MCILVGCLICFFSFLKVKLSFSSSVIGSVLMKTLDICLQVVIISILQLYIDKLLNFINRVAQLMISRLVSTNRLYLTLYLMVPIISILPRNIM